MKDWEKLLLMNKSWASDKIDERPHYFENLAKQQKPKYFWIGSEDSRVPVNEITSTQPGEIFIHRNIGNVVVNSDLNMLSALDYAVHHLQVEHIIVCGHYGCDGVRAAINHKDMGLINKWLCPIKDVYLKHETELDVISDENARLDLLVELNVKEQVYNLLKTGIIQRAWKENKAPTLHGWVYNLKDGIIKDLLMVEANTKIHDVYRYDFD